MKNKHKIPQIGIRVIAPNAVTILALCAGLTSIRFALDMKWEMSVLFIMIAGVFDGLDGSIARLLKSTSKFGAELDSLSDMISFGVAPTIILYLWVLNDLGRLGWVVALAFAVCLALRLARFNCVLDEDQDPLKKAGFLTGIPAPMAAMLALIPMMLEFELEDKLFQNPKIVAVTTVLVCFGMVSKIPTISSRQLMISREHMLPLLLCIGLFAAASTVYNWWVPGLLGVMYVVSIPFSMHKFRQFLTKEKSVPDKAKKP